METKKVVLAWIQPGRFNQLESKGYGCYHDSQRGTALEVGEGKPHLSLETPPIHQSSPLSGILTEMGK